MKNIRTGDLGKIFRIEKIKKWTKEEEDLLLSLVSANRRNKWQEICKSFKNKNARDCHKRFNEIRVDIERGGWTKKEDELIVNLVESFGKSWLNISKVLKNRTGKQIENGSINVLDNKIKKEKFSLEEDLRLLKLHGIYGNKWVKLVKFFPGRSADKLKNRYNSSIKNKATLLKCIDSLSNTKDNVIYLFNICLIYRALRKSLKTT